MTTCAATVADVPAASEPLYHGESKGSTELYWMCRASSPVIARRVRSCIVAQQGLRTADPIYEVLARTLVDFCAAKIALLPLE